MRRSFWLRSELAAQAAAKYPELARRVRKSVALHWRQGVAQRSLPVDRSANTPFVHSAHAGRTGPRRACSGVSLPLVQQGRWVRRRWSVRYSKVDVAQPVPAVPPTLAMRKFSRAAVGAHPS